MSNILSSAVPKNSDIMSGIKQMDQKDLQQTRKILEVAYFIAKHQPPIVTYTDFLKLEQKHGVNKKAAYQNSVSGGTFIEYIGDDLKRNLNADLAKAKFFSVLCDGSTDSTVIENEVIYPMPSNSDSVEVKISFLHMYQLKHQDADGVHDTISVNVKESISKWFKSIGIEGIDTSKKMIGFTSDGAAVNWGDKHSVKTILREESEWLVFVWCIAHHLELALSDALKDTMFKDIDEMLWRIYYLYQKAPKKLRQLRDLHETFKSTMDYLEGGCKPKKASGTRWIAHKLNAMKMILDKWGLYIVHLEHLSQDKSIKAKDRSKLIGYLNKWKQGRIPLMLAFFIDLLEIPSILSKCFQDEKIDPVYAMQCLNKADKRFELFAHKKIRKVTSHERLIEKSGWKRWRIFLSRWRTSRIRNCQKFMAKPESILHW